MASISLAWAANSPLDNTVAYEVWGANGTSVAFASCALLWRGDALSWTDTGLPNGQARTYYLVAVNAIGQSAVPEGPLNETAAAASSTYVQNLGGAPSVQEGTHASRPAAGNAGAIYVETDTGLIFRDTGSAWSQIGGGSLPTIGSGDILGNAGSGSAAAADTTLTALLDRVYGATVGQLIVRGSSAWQALAAGTSGYALVSNGAGAVPSYQAVGGTGGGALILLEQHTASGSASLNFTTAITSSYDDYVIEFVNVLPATNNNNLLARVSTNGGSTWDSSNTYQWTWFYTYHNGSTGTGGNSLDTSMNFGGNQQNNLFGFNGTVKLYDPLNASLYKQIMLDTGYDNTSGGIIRMFGTAAYLSATAVNAIQFFYSSGNIASGTIRIYGVAH